ncbi:MAG: ATP-dependent DNA helicase RecG, partial [Proteobacteria bacterium]|nr:ATP-dependent DNA helicase RecG [Pseudomonadota bacterium]
MSAAKSAPKPAAKPAGRGAAGFTKKLEKLGIRSRLDLVLHLPMRYEDETRLTPVDAAPPGAPVLVEAQVLRAEVAYRPRRQLVVHALSGDTPLALRFFNFYPSLLKQFERAIADDLRVRAFGEVRHGRAGCEMAHPRYSLVHPGAPLPEALTPVYPATAGVTQPALREAVLHALATEPLGDSIPAPIRKRFGLQDFAAAVRFLHLPPPGVDPMALVGRTHPAWHRVKFDELLAQQLSMRMHYLARRSRSAPVLRADGPLLAKFLGALPFRLTQAQQRCLAEITGDIAQAHPMQRLLQGDVGIGKTILAALSALAAVDAGWQAAVMAT